MIVMLAWISGGSYDPMAAAVRDDRSPNDLPCDFNVGKRYTVAEAPGVGPALGRSNHLLLQIPTGWYMYTVYFHTSLPAPVVLDVGLETGSVNRVLRLPTGRRQRDSR